MKQLILALVALTLTISAYASKDFSATQKYEILVQLNNICGDTWCGGDYDYNFIEKGSIVCLPSQSFCEVFFVLIPYDKTESQEITRSCQISKVALAKSLKIKPYEIIDDDLYNEFTECAADVVEGVQD